MSLEPLLSRIEPDGGIPPLERWNPECCGEMDLLIRGDGTWVHEGSPILRPRLVRLLSTVLRRESDGEYYLVTPVEKVRIRVEDRPFLIVDTEYLEAEVGPVWQMITNVGDCVMLDDRHRASISLTPGGEPVPEVPIRFGLAARFSRSVFYRLIEQAEQHQREDGLEFGLTSAGIWQPLGHVGTESL